MQPVELPDPILHEHEGFVVVRDDLLPGGTKRRGLHVFFDDAHDEYVYASPVQGAAQIALSHTARDYNKQSVIFCAERKTLHPNTLRILDLGATVHQVPMGFLSSVTAKAERYVAASPRRKLVPFGCDAPAFVEALAAVVARIPYTPTEVWSIASSGVLTRAMQRAWPDAKFYGIRVGHPPIAGKAEVIDAPEPFERNAKMLPPFPSCANYDAKAWRFIKQCAAPGALFWNVSA